MRQATVTLLTMIIECKPNAAAFVACPDTGDLLTRFLPSCGDFNCQVGCLCNVQLLIMVGCTKNPPESSQLVGCHQQELDAAQPVFPRVDSLWRPATHPSCVEYQQLSREPADE